MTNHDIEISLNDFQSDATRFRYKLSGNRKNKNYMNNIYYPLNNFRGLRYHMPYEMDFLDLHLYGIPNIIYYDYVLCTVFKKFYRYTRLVSIV